jgi:hypothetical protein
MAMPTHMHEAFIPFSQDMANQLYDSHFLPTQYRRTTIIQTGSTEFRKSLRGLKPDAGISFFKAQNTFLVLEVAYSQKEEDAQRKAQRYILESNGKIKFVVLVIVSKKHRKKREKYSSSNIPLQSVDEDTLSPHHDSVHVHVYKAVIRPPNILTGE